MNKGDLKSVKPGQKEGMRRITREQFDDAAALFRVLMKAAVEYGKSQPNVSMEDAFDAALGTVGVRCAAGDARRGAVGTLVGLVGQAALVTAALDTAAANAGRISDDMMTTQEAANYLGVCRQHVVELTVRGLLSVRMVGRYRRLLRKEVEEYHRNGLKRASAAAGLLAKRQSPRETSS